MKENKNTAKAVALTKIIYKSGFVNRGVKVKHKTVRLVELTFNTLTTEPLETFTAWLCQCF